MNSILCKSLICIEAEDDEVKWDKIYKVMNYKYK